MKSFKKILSVILAVTLLLSLFCTLSACFGKSGDDDGQGTQATEETQPKKEDTTNKNNSEEEEDEEEGKEVEGPDGLTFVVLEDGTYGVSAFASENATEVVIPSEYNGKSITSIESSAFKDCAELASITIPNTVTSIGYYAFYGCEALKSITIPVSVTSVGASVFSGCKALESNDYYMQNCKIIIENREYTTCELQKRGFEVLPSKANFIFAKSNKIGGKELYLELKKRGVLVRHFDKDRIKDYNRITIGTKEQMLALLSAVDEILKEC